MNLRKLRLIEEAKKSFGSLSINEALLAYLRRFYDSTTSVAELVSKYLRGVFNAPNFDGVDDYGVLTYPIPFLPDSELEVGFRLEAFRATNQPAIYGPTAASDFSSRAVINADGSLVVRPTVSEDVDITAPAGTIKLNTNYVMKLTRSGNTYNLFINGAPVGAVTSANNPMNLQTFARAATLRYFPGFIYYIKINGTLWRMADRNQAIQLPEPSGLGAELITPTVLENPAVQGSQWTYLGAGRWQYVGDGTLNALEFITQGAQPNSGFLEFEIESISGALSCSYGSLPASTFTTIGVKRYFYTNKSGDVNTAIQFKRSGPGIVTSCIIKNISFKPLGTCNPMTLVNVTSDRWQEVVQ